MITHKIDEKTGMISLWDDDRLLMRLSRCSAIELNLWLYPDDASTVKTSLCTDLTGQAILTETTTDERNDEMDFSLTQEMLLHIVEALNSDTGGAVTVSAAHEVRDGGADWLCVNVEKALSNGKIAKGYYHFELKNAGMDYLTREEDAAEV